jgi:hypothetical protein
MRGIQLLRVLFALMFMALPSFQAKVDEAVSTPASAGAATVRIEQITGAGGTFPPGLRQVGRYSAFRDWRRRDLQCNRLRRGSGPYHQPQGRFWCFRRADFLPPAIDLAGADIGAPGHLADHHPGRQAPGNDRPLPSSDHRRRRSGPVITSTRAIAPSHWC